MKKSRISLRAVIVGLVVLFASYAVWDLFVNPRVEALNTAAGQLDNAAQQLEDRTVRATLTEEEETELAADNEALNVLFPAAADEKEIIAELTSVFLDAGVEWNSSTVNTEDNEITSFNPTDARVGQLIEIELNIAVTGTVPQIQVALEAIEQAERTYTVTGLSMSSGNDDVSNVVTAQVAVTAYAWLPSLPAPVVDPVTGNVLVTPTDPTSVGDVESAAN